MNPLNDIVSDPPVSNNLNFSVITSLAYFFPKRNSHKIYYFGLIQKRITRGKCLETSDLYVFLFAYTC